MTIRYKCHVCDSKLNIKEELAGTAGTCPKCKTEFTVPEFTVPDAPSAEADKNVADEKTAQDGSSAHVPSDPGTASAKSRPSARAKMAEKSVTKPPSEDADFDPVAFLMTEEPASSPSRSTPPLSDDEIPADLELEISDDEPPRRRSRARRQVTLDSDAEMDMGSASASAGAMLSGGASAGAARDLLTRTVEESRARAAHPDDDAESERSAATEIAKELFIRGAPGLVGIALIAFGVYWVVNAVIGGGMELPYLGRVSGTITLDGAPLAGATIKFLPMETEVNISDTKTLRARTSIGTTDENGFYEMNYMEGVKGAVIGAHRISISKRDGRRELAPSKFGPYSMEQRTVESGSNTFDFPLEADAPRRRRPGR